ncbi:hypothetical protein HanIR_Chr04g0199271 [Helianthus annuus]|nr:hypothetical protein HanIR_Chr04g0199271 [Helianthus annuus]
MLFLMLLYFTVRYSLLNVLDPKAAGAMIEAILPEGKPVWLNQIHDRFLHPTSDSFATYANAILGEDGGNDFDDTTDPTREEVIVLSSEGSDRSRESLIPRSTRAGPPQGTGNEPVNEPVGDDADPPVDTAEQLETRKKKLDKSEKKKKKVEENVTEAPRKQHSNLPFLDYVVVSDMLSGLAGDKRAECDPDDDAILTEIMQKKKVLEEKKKELDKQAAAALVVKKSKLQKETPPVPSESEVDLGVFSVKHGNLLENIFAASGSQGTKFCICVKSGKAPRKVDISKITPPTSPPSRTFGLSPPHVDRVKRKEDDVEVEHVREGGGDADVGAAKVVRGSGQGGASGTHYSPEYEYVQDGSWDTHNPACTDLPHDPRWNLTQGSRMTELANCREFFSLSIPPC